MKSLIVLIHFKSTNITPYAKTTSGGSNLHRARCQGMKYRDKSIVINFSQKDLDEKEVKTLITGRELKGYGDSLLKYIEIPIFEIYSADARII